MLSLSATVIAPLLAERLPLMDVCLLAGVLVSSVPSVLGVASVPSAAELSAG